MVIRADNPGRGLWKTKYPLAVQKIGEYATELHRISGAARYRVSSRYGRVQALRQEIS